MAGSAKAPLSSSSGRVVGRPMNDDEPVLGLAKEPADP